MKKTDNRALKGNLLSELCPGGKFSTFTDFVKNTPELALCFRGNASPEEADIYYNNHILWRLKYCIRSGCSVAVSFNHARYTADWQNQLQSLCKNYAFHEKEMKNYRIGDLISRFGTYDSRFVSGTYGIMKPIMDDYFDIEKGEDFFRGSDNQTPRKKNNLIEKIAQQRLYSMLDNTKDGLFVYDLEFAQPHKDSHESEAEGMQNKPDILALQFENGNPVSLIFAEVKSKSGSTKGKSGTDKHMIGMSDYLKMNQEYIKNRQTEAHDILECYHRLGLRRIVKSYDLQAFLNLPIEIMVIYTDELANNITCDEINKAKNYHYHIAVQDATGFRKLV